MKKMGYVVDRQQRIKSMEARAWTETLKGLDNGSKGWIKKARFIADFQKDYGVRERLANEYFDIEVKTETFEYMEDNKEYFRNRLCVARMEENKKQAENKAM